MTNDDLVAWLRSKAADSCASGRISDGPAYSLAAHRLEAAGRMADALDRIAAWHDGPVVNGSFDEPGSAQTAREALAAWRETL